jgi:hypothetical protein
VKKVCDSALVEEYGVTICEKPWELPFMTGNILASAPETNVLDWVAVPLDLFDRPFVLSMACRTMYKLTRRDYAVPEKADEIFAGLAKRIEPDDMEWEDEVENDLEDDLEWT